MKMMQFYHSSPLMQEMPTDMRTSLKAAKDGPIAAHKPHKE